MILLAVTARLSDSEYSVQSYRGGKRRYAKPRSNAGKVDLDSSPAVDFRKRSGLNASDIHHSVATTHNGPFKKTLKDRSVIEPELEWP